MINVIFTPKNKLRKYIDQGQDLRISAVYAQLSSKVNAHAIISSQAVNQEAELRKLAFPVAYKEFCYHISIGLCLFFGVSMKERCRCSLTYNGVMSL